MYGPPDWFSAVLLLVLGVAMLYDRVSPDEPDEHTVEGAREAYTNGEITLDEYERRVALAVDPETDRIRAAVEPIAGVGEQTSRQLAREFDTLAELQDADREELEAVNRIGESRAKAILERLEESPD